MKRLSLRHPGRRHRCRRRPGRRRRQRGAHGLRPGPLGRPGPADRPCEAEERHPPDRRRHGRLHDHRRAQLLGGRLRPPRARRAPVQRGDDDVRPQGRRRPGLPHRLRLRLRPDRQRLVDRQEDRRRPHLAGPLDRGHRGGRELRDGPREAQEDGQADRRRLHRRDHRRHPGGRGVAHQRPRLPGPDRHDRVPVGEEGRRRPRLDRRAARRQQGRRPPRRRHQPLREAARGRLGERPQLCDVEEGLPLGRHQDRARRHHQPRRRHRCWACSARAT